MLLILLPWRGAHTGRGAQAPTPPLELSEFGWRRGESLSPLPEHKVLPELLPELQNSTTFFLASHFRRLPGNEDYSSHFRLL